jgi:hypothetical protein
MIILNNNSVLISLENPGGLEGVSVLKNSLLNLLINIDTENHSDKVLEDVVEVAWLLKSLELNGQQAWQIQKKINEDKEFAKHFTNTVSD